MKTSLLKHAFLAMALMSSSTIALASGSDAVGAAQTGDRAAYALGKRVYATKIACSSCPMSGKSLNKESAMMMMSEGTGANLSSSEQHALEVYLKKRFKL